MTNTKTFYMKQIPIRLVANNENTTFPRNHLHMFPTFSKQTNVAQLSATLYGIARTFHILRAFHTRRVFQARAAFHGAARRGVAAEAM